MVSLNCVWDAFYIQGGLIQIDGVGDLIVRRGRIRIGTFVRGTGVRAHVDPAINLDVRFLPPISMRSGLERNGQRIGSGIGIADPGRSSDGPYRERERWIGHRRRVAAIFWLRSVR